MIYCEAFAWDRATTVLRTRATEDAPDVYCARDVATGATAHAHNARTAVARLRRGGR